MPQWLNVGGLSMAVQLALGRRPRELLLPHMRVGSVAEVPFSSLRQAGANLILFDKDNTLTLPFAPSFPPLSLQSVFFLFFL